MVFVYKDDGYPEACEFKDNYVWMDARNPASVERVLGRAAKRTAAPPDVAAGVRRFSSIAPGGPRPAAFGFGPPARR